MRQLKISQKITNRESVALERYLSEIAKIETISPDEEVALTVKIKAGDQAALDTLVKSNLRFVVSVAKQYQNNGLTLNDLINEGNVGLLKAAKRFDETRGFKFITFAVWWIRQAILTAIIENSRMIRLPYNKYHSQKQINTIYQSFLQEFEREPSPEEISELFGMKPEDVYSILQSGNKTVSLDSPVDGQEGGFEMIDTIGDNSAESPDLALIKESMSEELNFGLVHLSPREREILSLMYGLDGEMPKGLEEVAARYGMSSERTRQVKEHAFRRLRRYFNQYNIKPFNS
ncbi:MAG: RNA polymerase sigma factor RpoD/SigA [Saprospiraceae bacterium]|nr:RNA polymerase sigma factor RpoD/SigA [Saprospiraceae bacterium]MBK8449921.1 RNA polymerase sigma factor RpoD/SigA [Saprospiraceae bacterium]MBK8484020.1 RNA polymerase sigma factor RpoD/SigA [Saprospiraceae bacterium]MBK9221426.1 RNA polymerase sigma factor RpoD/SigA [Saprospiraceae bacterium]MBK9721636.1 RNA polymerase sigma factor RpoD/SigA [Saprospiraceae bacterium]